MRSSRIYVMCARTNNVSGVGGGVIRAIIANVLLSFGVSPNIFDNELKRERITVENVGWTKLL